MSRSPALKLPRVLVALVALSFAALAVGAPPSLASPLTREVQVYPLGDSITLGLCNGCPGNQSPGGYRTGLDALLAAAHITHMLVGTSEANPGPELELRGEEHHDGHSGFRVGQITTALDGLLTVGHAQTGDWLTGDADHDPIHPDVVILHAGTNDILQRFDPAYRFPTKDGGVDFTDPAQRNQFINDLTKRLQTLVDKIVQLRPDARIVLSNVVPIESGEFEPATRTYAAAISRLVRTEQGLGHRVTLADVFTAFTRQARGGDVNIPGLMSHGGIHPTPAGYAVMARIYKAAVSAVLDAWPVTA